MSNYFINFPSVKYGKHSVKDITRRAKVIEKLTSNPYAFLPYTIEEGQTPEDIAHYYYQDIGLSWLVLLANNIVDWQSEWPLTDDLLRKQIEDKYVYECAICTINRTNVALFNPIFDKIAEIMVHIALNTDATVVDVLADGDVSYTTIYEYLYNNVNAGFTIDPESTDSYQVQAVAYIKNNLPDHLAEVIVRIPDKDDLKLEFDVVAWTQDATITRNIVEYRNESNEGEFAEVAISRQSYAAQESVQGWYPIRIYDWEFEQNENKRHIKLVNEAFAVQVKSELASILND